jgi:hypothetical protein
MVRIAITQAAFDAIAKTLPLGSVGYENATNEKGERLIWLDSGVVDRLRSLRASGEDYCRPHGRSRLAIFVAGARSLSISSHIGRRSGTPRLRSWRAPIFAALGPCLQRTKPGHAALRSAR